MTGRYKTLMGKPMKQALIFIAAALGLLTAAEVSLAAEPAAKELGRGFSMEVQPFLKTIGIGGAKKEGSVPSKESK